MKYISLVILTLIFISCQQQDNKSVVKSYLEARNTYDLDAITELLTEDYQEKFIDGSIEIESLKDLKNQIAWGEMMDSKVKLKSIKENGENVITVEEFFNFQDEVLRRYPRSFEITYTLDNGKIQSSIIDTIAGANQVRATDDIRIQQLFTQYIKNNNITLDQGMNATTGQQLRNALEAFVADAKK